MAAAALLTAGCGDKKIDPELGAVELEVNRSPQDARPRATTPEAAGTALADKGAARLRKGGGSWEASATGCEPSGPVISCVLVVTGTRTDSFTCSARVAVRLIDKGQATARRTPYTCKTAGT
jgi:hypothetical protein